MCWAWYCMPMAAISVPSPIVRAGMLHRAQMPDRPTLVDQAMALALQVNVEQIDAAFERNQLEGVDTSSDGMSRKVMKIHGKLP